MIVVSQKEVVPLFRFGPRSTPRNRRATVCSPHDLESLDPGNRVRRLRGGGDERGAGQPVPARPALFTDAQAASGEALYRQSCASCHGATLTGGTAPALTGPAFEASWGNPRVTLADIFFIARTTMPPRASSSLTPQDHAAVFAYILKANGFPSGASVLTAASETLEGTRLRADGARAPERAAPPAFIAGAPGAAPAATGPDQATLNGGGAIDRLAVSHARLRRDALLAAPGDQHDDRRHASRRRACSRSASATISRPARSSTTARCT